MKISKIDINHLTEQDIKTLIDAEKHPTNVLRYREIINQIEQTLILSSNSYKCLVKDKVRNIIYDFHVHMTPIATIFSIGLMFRDNKYHLVRLDFGENLRHTNYANTEHSVVIYGSHAHFNAPSGKYSPKNVVPIGNISEFKNIKKIRDALIEFIDYTNIKKK